MGLQYFGWGELNQEKLSLMVCIDADRPRDWMLHWWGGSAHARAGAALIYLDAETDSTLTFSPVLLYRVPEQGGSLYLPILSPEEQQFFLQWSLSLTRSGRSLTGAASHPSGISATLHVDLAESHSVNADACSSWGAYKEWAALCRAQHQAFAFRGHGSSAFRLQTSLHRQGRHRLERYGVETLPEFRAHAEAVLGEKFDLNSPDDYGVLLGLAQHHGLPTPMLDWTLSPYIAAFFAFSDALEAVGTRANATHVRVYALTRAFLFNNNPSVVMLAALSPYACALAISPRGNQRLYAQQGQFIVTNVGDLEGLLVRMEGVLGQRVVLAADIPIACAEDALEDLAYMGLSPATMFPGLDGVCRKMRHEMRFRRPPLSLPSPGRPSGPSLPAEEARSAPPVPEIPEPAGRSKQS